MADGVDIALRLTFRQSHLHLYRFHRNVIPRYLPDNTGQAIYWRRGERTLPVLILKRSQIALKHTVRLVSCLWAKFTHVDNSRAIVSRTIACT